MRYNRSLFTVYSFITHHLFQFCTKNFHLRPKQVFPPFLLSLFSYFCFKIKYHLILTKNENRLIGDMGIIFTGHERMQVEVGCTLNKAFQGKGYATEALTAMVNHFFMTLKKHRIVASIDPRNTASIRLIERLGFRKEAHFKESYFLRGEWVDDIIYAMLDKDWSN